MQLESIKNILNQDSSNFDNELREQLEDALKNHPKVLRARRLTEIYSRITELNSEISDLLREAKSLDEDNTIPETVDGTPIEDCENVEVEDEVASQAKFLDKDFKDNIFNSVTDTDEQVEDNTDEILKDETNG